MHITQILVAIATTVVSGRAAATSGLCPLIGPDYPASRAPGSTKAMQKAVELFQQALSQALTNSSSAVAFNGSTISFSFEAWSTMEEAPIHTFHHNAESLPQAGTTNVTSSTVYRLGSLSKLLTTYTWLAAIGDEHWLQPITNFIPELAAAAAQDRESSDDIDTNRWANITVAALASQLSGIQKDPALPAAVYTSRTPIPSLPPSQDIPENAQGLTCDTYAYVPCTRESYINSLLAAHPVFAPDSQPVYSDTAYSLLALALANITGSSFDDVFDDKLVQALNLEATSTQAPKDLSAAIIPVNDTTALFTPSLGLLQPGGGFYSSLNDLTTIGRAILTDRLLLPSTTNKWIKPAAFLPDDRAVGAPWEIYQAVGTNKTTWMYTKSGDLGSYSNNFVLFPNYNAGFTVLTAGLNAATVSRILSDIAATAFAPAFEAAAKEEAIAYTGDYAGSFENAASNGTDTFEMTLELDEMPGLGVKNYTINGVDFQTVIAVGAGLKRDDIQLRLYPTGLTGPGINGTQLQGWRMFRYSPSSSEPTPVGAVFSSPRCNEWFSIGGFTSGVARGANGGLDEFAFSIGDEGNGEVEAVQVKTWNRYLTKV